MINSIQLNTKDLNLQITQKIKVKKTEVFKLPKLILFKSTKDKILRNKSNNKR